MKYLVGVDDCFLDRPGGMGRVAWDILTLMRDRGHEVAMVAARPQPDGAPPVVTVEDGVRILRYSRPMLPAWHPLRGQRTIAAATKATRTYFADEHWDIVHLHSPFTGAALLRALGSGPRYVYTMHSPVVLEQRLNWAKQGTVGRVKMTLGLGALKRVEREVLRRCDSIHTLSEFCAIQVEQFHGLGERVAVVPYWRRPELRRECTKAEARQQLGWPVEEKILISVRKLGPRYGVETAIEAVAPLARARQCLFVIGGDGPLRGALTQLANRLDVRDRVRFTGRLDDVQLRLAYQAADLFLLPTAALECFGLIIIEALSFGCPVLSTDAGAIPELMQPILPGFIVPAGDVNALRAQIERFLAGDLVPPPAEALVAHVERYFGRAIVTAQLIALLEHPQMAPAAARLAS